MTAGLLTSLSKNFANGAADDRAYMCGVTVYFFRMCHPERTASDTRPAALNGITGKKEGARMYFARDG